MKKKSLVKRCASTAMLLTISGGVMALEERLAKEHGCQENTAHRWEMVQRADMESEPTEPGRETNRGR